jgi:hypothetical protein
LRLEPELERSPALERPLDDERLRPPEDERLRPPDAERLRPPEDERLRPPDAEPLLTRRDSLDRRREEPPLLEELPLRCREEPPFSCGWGECELSVS